MYKGIIYLITLSTVAMLLACRPTTDGTLTAAEADETKAASPSNPTEVAVYDTDSQHLWNRLYAALYVRAAGDGQSYGQDELDPLLWENSTYLLAEPRYQLVFGLLNAL